MPYGLIHYNAPGDDFDAFVSYAAETGFQCVEVMIHDVWPANAAFDPEPAHAARAVLKRYGVTASALTAANDFIVLDPRDVDSQVQRMRQVAELARILGTDTLRTEGGRPKDEVPEDRWAEAMAGCLRACLPFCEEWGIRLAVDNHGLVTNNPTVLLDTLNAVDSPLVGTNLDTMNYRWWGNPVEALPGIFRDVAPFVFHTHLKDGVGVRGDYQGMVLGAGEVPLREAVDALVAAGYRGAWCAEWEGRSDKGQGYADCLAWMREHCPPT